MWWLKERGGQHSFLFAPKEVTNRGEKKVTGGYLLQPRLFLLRFMVCGEGLIEGLVCRWRLIPEIFSLQSKSLLWRSTPSIAKEIIQIQSKAVHRR